MIMKKITVAIIAILFTAATASAQKFAFIDSEYILKNIPAYESAQDQLDQASTKWQQEVEAMMEEVKTMYQNYQNELVFLSEEMKVKRENEIIAREKEAQELKRKYFGPEGELFKKRESLIKPIQDELYNAVKEVADERGYDAIFDKSSSNNLIYSSSKNDISDIVLDKLGYSK
jgi:outer membrane protein